MTPYAATLLLSALVAVTAQVPSWPQSWALRDSTAMMSCNYSNFMNPSTTVGWTIVDVDWCASSCVSV